MSIHEDVISKMAKLARLRLAPEEAKHLTEDLGQILELVDQMAAAETENVEPLAHPHDTIQALREDRVTETNQREAFQALASRTEAGLYLVPKVIDS